MGISYTCVLLDDKSRQAIANEFKRDMPLGWEWICDHMTIKLGELSDEDKHLLGRKVTLKINSFGVDDNVMAIGVSGFASESAIPHITLAVNRAIGAKPSMSNNISDNDWMDENGLNFELTGIVAEIENQMNINEGIEGIDASEAYRADSALDTILNGKRNICVLVSAEINPYRLKLIKDANLNMITVQKTGHEINDRMNLVIIYREPAKYKQLYDYMVAHDGYLKDSSPDEAWTVGKLLEYNDESVMEFINRNYGGKLPFQENMNLNEEYNIKSLPFFNDIKNAGGSIFQVGGATRDKFLGKSSKDLDILVSGIPAEKLTPILKKYGKVNAVGASFGVIKFTPPGGEEIDIALPRTEKLKAGGTGHKDFDVTADHTLPIEKDLYRRDITINSMATDEDGKLIDPFGGKKDLDAKVIRVTNPDAFADDALRMIRCVQFSARFGFTIEPETFKMIQQNADKIAEISKERILIEFEKITSKGSPIVGATLLVESGLYKGIFGVDFDGNFEPFSYVTKMSEFVYWLIEHFTQTPDYYFKTIMKGDLQTTKEIAALAYLYANIKGNDIFKQRWVYSKINEIAPTMLDSNFVTSLLSDIIDDFTSKRFPLNYKGLAINGNDLIAMGIKGQSIGEMLEIVLNAIYSEVIENNKTEILKFVKQKSENLNESVQTEEKVVKFFDFDGCLVNSVQPEEGMPLYKAATGKDYPHKGWWNRPESLDLDIFDIQPNSEIERAFREATNDKNAYTVLLTSRQKPLKDHVMKILQKHNMVFDDYAFRDDERDKGERILDIMIYLYPDVKKLEFYDDDFNNIQSVHDSLIDTDYDYVVHPVENGKIIS
jgi:tRNA nucleotidyltransferase/poly(A) polymerase